MVAPSAAAARRPGWPATTVVPSGQVQSSNTTPATAAAPASQATTATATSSPVTTTATALPNDTAGLQAVLDQIAASLARAAVPMLRSEVLPVLQQDRALQATIGRAAGESVARRLRPWVIVGALALATIAGVQVAKFVARTRRRGAAAAHGRRGHRGRAARS